MPIQIHFNPREWERIEADWQAWWAGELDRPILMVDGLVPAPGLENIDPFISRFSPQVPVDEVLEYYRPYLEAQRWYGDAYPKAWLNFGAGVVSAFLGSQVNHSTGTTWFEPLPGVESLEEIRLEYDPHNVWWQRVQHVAVAMVEQLGGQMALGMTDLGGNLDILAGLRGTQKLLVDLVEAPQQVDRLLKEISALWLRYFDELDAILTPSGRGSVCWAPLWAPSRNYMLQSDFSYMISPRMFKRFVLPDLNVMNDSLDYTFYHLDGKGELAHLDMLLAMDQLRGIQWQPGDGAPQADEWPEVLGKIRAAGKLCQIYLDPEHALRFVRENDARGFVIQVMGYFPPEEAEALISTLKREAAR